MSNDAHDPDDVASRELKPDEAKALFRDIAANHDVSLTKHAEKQMAQRHMVTADAMNILRAGEVVKVELRFGEFRYRVATSKMCLVVTPLSKTRLRVLTGWREEEDES